MKKTTTKKATVRSYDDLDPPVVRDVREARSRLVKKAGGTAQGLFDLVYGKGRKKQRRRSA